MMHVNHYASYKEMSVVGKSVFVEKIRSVMKEKGSVVVAIPGGRSVVGLLKLLGPHDLDWSKVDVFMVDERLVPLDDKESNFNQDKKLFLDKVKAKGHPFDYMRTAEEYTEELRKVSSSLTFDVVLLAAGEDAHVASLHPLHHSIRNKEKGFFIMDDSPKLPKDRLSASPDMIKESDFIVLLFASAAKKGAFDLFENPDVGEMECPAKIVKKAKEVYVLTSFT